MKKQHQLAYQAIKDVSKGHHGAITKLLVIIGVSRQAYNKGLKRQETVWELRDQRLKERAQYWFDFHHQGIGAGNLLENLRQDEQINFPVTFKQVRRVMRELDIHCQIRKKKHNRVKQSEQYIQDNVLNRKFKVTAPNQVWLSDSTELSYGINGEYKVRLSGVLDLYGRRLLAYNLSITETSAAEIQVFQRAFTQAGDVHPMVHTDRGTAYTSKSFNQFMDQFQVRRSMSRPGTPYDNAPMERWWNDFKLVWLAKRVRPKSMAELEQSIQQAIKYFNTERAYASKNGLSAEKFRAQAA